MESKGGDGPPTLMVSRGSFASGVVQSDKEPISSEHCCNLPDRREPEDGDGPSCPDVENSPEDASPLSLAGFISSRSLDSPTDASACKVDHEPSICMNKDPNVADTVSEKILTVSNRARAGSFSLPDDDLEDITEDDLEDFLRTSLFNGESNELDDEHVPNISRRNFQSMLLDNLGILIGSDDVIDEMFADCSKVSNLRSKQKIEMKDITQYIRNTDTEKTEEINPFRYISTNFFKSISNWMSVFFFVGAILSFLNALVPNPTVSLFSMILFGIGTLVFTLKSYERFEDRFDHIMRAKRMINRWYKQFFVFHLKTDEPKKVSKISSERVFPRRQACLVYMENIEDPVDRMSFSDFFRPNSLSAKCLDKLLGKQGVNISELTILLESSSIFIQQDIMREIFHEMDLDESKTIDLKEFEKFAREIELDDESKSRKVVSLLRKCMRSWGFWANWVWLVGSISFLMYFLLSSDIQQESGELLIIGNFSYLLGGIALLPHVYNDATKYYTRLDELGRALLALSVSIGKNAREESHRNAQEERRRSQRVARAKCSSVGEERRRSQRVARVKRSSVQEERRRSRRVARAKKSSGSIVFNSLPSLIKRRKSSIKRDSFTKNIFFSFIQWTHRGSVQSVKETDEWLGEENNSMFCLDCIQMHNILFQSGILIELDIFSIGFQKADTNGDGILSVEEFTNFALHIKETQEVLHKCLILKAVLQRYDFHIALIYVAAGVGLVLNAFSKDLKFSSTMIKFSSSMYALGVFVGMFMTIKKLSFKFYTIRNCRIRFNNEIIKRALKYAEH
eukprot:CAMPEP_0194291364 /NCGR_PEP_ID=MMETSP0169-20130528/43215_1 /TAXON_ID=218684 /ORGANISM="Corethron pennatum, Strain L29A3" /LENGTH=795 /DNA_ID=CAMNT_0039039227 /DNA_START=325 /DNA_END=2712 /DNA_ORIENTATION=+